MSSRIKLHLGCGWRNFGEEWIHIDNGDYKHLTYKSDISKLPMIVNESVDLIYASHVIAYFNRDEIKDVLEEWNRILKPNGVLRLATPDLQSLVMVYQDENEISLDNILGPLYGKMDMDGNSIYHKTIYDFKSLKKILKDNNFVKIKRYDWRDTEHSSFDDHSQAYIPHMDKENGILISLNIECKKK